MADIILWEMDMRISNFGAIGSLLGMVITLTVGNAAIAQNKTLTLDDLPDIGTLERGSDCVRAQRISGWQPVSRELIVLETSDDERFLVRVDDRGAGTPRFEVFLRTQNRGRICGQREVELTIGEDPVTILDIWKLPQSEVGALGT